MTLLRQDIEARALAVLASAGEATVPILVDRVAESLGAELHFETLDDNVSGMLVCKGAAKHIAINAGHHPNRQRFTVAHECGHLVLHHGVEDRLFLDTHIRVYQRNGSSSSTVYAESGSTTTPEEERQANEFASALLMPKALLEEHVERFSLDLADEYGVSLLAISFGVSEQAMSIRLQQLRLISPAS